MRIAGRVLLYANKQSLLDLWTQDSWEKSFSGARLIQIVYEMFENCFENSYTAAISQLDSKILYYMLLKFSAAISLIGPNTPPPIPFCSFDVRQLLVVTD